MSLLNLDIPAVDILIGILLVAYRFHKIDQKYRTDGSRLGAETLRRRLTGGNAIAFNGEAGYQATLLMPGIQLKPGPV